MSKQSRFVYILLVILGIGIPFFVVFKNIYPDIRSSFLARTEFGLGFNPVNLAGTDYLVVSLATQYPFNQTDLSLRLKEGASPEVPVRISLARDYMVNTYPIGQVIQDETQLRSLLFEGNPEGVPSGSLYSHGISVFAVSRGKAYPIVAPEVFESLGYHWDNVEQMSGTEYARLQEAEKMNFLSVHPDGTLLRTKAGQFYLVWEQQRRPIVDEELLERVWKSAYWVDIAGDEAGYFAEKEVPVSSSGKIKTTFRYSPQAVNTLGNVYIIKIEPAIVDKMAQGSSEFETSFTLDKTFLKFSLGQIKNKLYTRYVGFFF